MYTTELETAVIARIGEGSPDGSEPMEVFVKTSSEEIDKVESANADPGAPLVSALDYNAGKSASVRQLQKVPDSRYWRKF